MAVKVVGWCDGSLVVSRARRETVAAAIATGVAARRLVSVALQTELDALHLRRARPLRPTPHVGGFTAVPPIGLRGPFALIECEQLGGSDDHTLDWLRGGDDRSHLLERAGVQLS